jgi:hypothetical protein
MACWAALGGALHGQVVSKDPPPVEAPTPKSLDWKAPDIGRGLFTDALGMLEREREEYANNLAAEATARAMEVRRILALSLQLAPRNRQALVLSFQLGRGVLPTQRPDGYSREVLARLLITRAGMLRKQTGEENLLMARAFTELAADLDPKNEDAVYASEVQRLDHSNVDWSKFTDPPK